MFSPFVLLEIEKFYIFFYQEEGFPETFFETKISQYTVYYILLYPLWIDKFIATKKRPDKTDLFIVSQMSSYQATSS